MTSRPQPYRLPRRFLKQRYIYIGNRSCRRLVRLSRKQPSDPNNFIAMRWPLHLCGTIHDLTLSVSWDRNSLIEQVDRRVGILCDLGVRSGNPVAIVHGSSASFVADLLAVWSCGAVAVLLDATLAENELSTLVRFVKPAAARLCSSHRAPPARRKPSG